MYVTCRVPKSTLPVGLGDQLTVFLSPDAMLAFFLVKRFILYMPKVEVEASRSNKIEQ